METNKTLKSFEIVPNDGYKIIKLIGALEADSAKIFNESLNDILTTPPVDIIFNLENVSDICNQWIRSLMSIQQALKAVNKQMRLISVSDEIVKLLRREGVNSVLKHHSTLKAALIDLNLAAPVALDVNFINPFLVAAAKVLDTQASTKSTAGKIYKKDAREKFTGDISGVIGLVSEAFTGSVVISFPENTFLKIMSRMLGEEYTKINKEIEDGAGEITNMIFGQAKVTLNNKGYGIKTALPSVVTGNDHSILQMSNGPRMVFPFETDVGEFFIEICVSA